MTPSINPTQNLALNETTGRVQATINDYVAFLQRQPAICGMPQQHEELTNHVAQGLQLIKLVNAERLKITCQLDEQKHDWIELEKELTAPLHQAMQPLKDAVEHYNRRDGFSVTLGEYEYFSWLSGYGFIPTLAAWILVL